MREDISRVFRGFEETYGCRQVHVQLAPEGMHAAPS
jgi:hypothetical protein